MSAARAQDASVMALPLATAVPPDAGQAGPHRSPTATGGCSSRSGTASAASCSATATTSSWPAATSGRSPATSPSCSSRCGDRSPSGASSTARSSSPTATGRGLDFDALLQRIHPAESRVRRLAAETPASYVAFDLLALGDDVLLDAPAVGAPRPSCCACSRPEPPVHLTPASTDRGDGRRVVRPLRGRRARRRRRQAPRRPVPAGQAGARQGQARAHRRLRRRRLPHPQGRQRRRLAAARAVRRRRPAAPRRRGGVVLGEVPRRAAGRAGAAHPRRDRRPPVARLGRVAAHRRGPQARGDSRWNAGKDLSWVPIRVERVAEVTFGQLEKRRFRHGVSFVRWRPDREPVELPLRAARRRRPVPFEELVDPLLGAVGTAAPGSATVVRSRGVGLSRPSPVVAVVAGVAVEVGPRSGRARRRGDVRRRHLAVGGQHVEAGRARPTGSRSASSRSTCIVHAPAHRAAGGRRRPTRRCRRRSAGSPATIVAWFEPVGGTNVDGQAGESPVVGAADVDPQLVPADLAGRQRHRRGRCRSSGRRTVSTTA